MTDVSYRPEEDDDELAPGVGLFAGDTGQFSANLRSALVLLVRGRSMSAAKHPAAWDALLRNRAQVKQFMAELMQTVIINETYGFAIARQSDSESGVPILMKRLPLTITDSAVIVHLRRALMNVSGTDEPAVVSVPTIAEEIVAFQIRGAGNEAGTVKTVGRSITKMAENGLITPVRGSEERFIVNPLLATLFNVEEITTLRDALRAGNPNATDTPEEDSDD